MLWKESCGIRANDTEFHDLNLENLDIENMSLNVFVWQSSFTAEDTPPPPPVPLLFFFFFF